jgi:hypothetical protein
MEDEHGEPSEDAYKKHHATDVTHHPKGKKIDLKDCKVNTAEKRSNCHKHF